MTPPVGTPDWRKETTNSGWSSQGVWTDVGVGDLMAQTPALPAGFYDLLFMFKFAAPAGMFQVDHMAAGGGSTIKSQLVRVPADGFRAIRLPGVYRVADNEFFRIINRIAGVGANAICSIIYRRFPE